MHLGAQAGQDEAQAFIQRGLAVENALLDQLTTLDGVLRVSLLQF
jgi:hypothetical protein